MTSRAERRHPPKASPEANGAAAAAEAVRTIAAPGIETSDYRLSNGVLLRFGATPPGAIRAAVQRVERPEVPKTYIDAKDRWEENPSDPTYIGALNDYLSTISVAAQAVAFMLATTVVEVPEGVYPADADEWVALMEAAGLDVPGAGPAPDDVSPVTHKARRLHSWLTLYAIRTEEEQFTCSALSLRKAGLTEEEVAQAIASFRSGAVGRTDRTGADAERGDSDGDRVPEPDPGADSGD